MLFIEVPIEEPLLENRKLIDDPNAVPYDLSKADGQKIVIDYCYKGFRCKHYSSDFNSWSK